MSIPTVFISPGHSHLAEGAINTRLNLFEHRQAQKVTAALAKANAVQDICQYCFVPSINLQAKVDFINSRCAEDSIAIEIHFNASRRNGATGQGTETLYYPTSARGENLANLVQNSLMRSLPFIDRGIKPRDDLHFLSETKIPAIIVELLFIDHDIEASYLLHPRASLIMARALNDGLIRYLTCQPQEDKTLCI